MQLQQIHLQLFFTSFTYKDNMLLTHRAKLLLPTYG